VGKLDKKIKEAKQVSNEEYVNEIVNKYAGLFEGCLTEEDRQAKLATLTDDERREIGNVAVYIKLKALQKFSSLSKRDREELKQGNVEVLSK